MSISRSLTDRRLREEWQDATFPDLWYDKKFLKVQRFWPLPVRPSAPDAPAAPIMAYFSGSLHPTEFVADLLFRLAGVNRWSAAPSGPFDDRWEPRGHTSPGCQRDAWYSGDFPRKSSVMPLKTVFDSEEKGSVREHETARRAGHLTRRGRPIPPENRRGCWPQYHQTAFWRRDIHAKQRAVIFLAHYASTGVALCNMYISTRDCLFHLV